MLCASGVSSIYQSHLYCLDRDTGEEKWRFDTGSHAAFLHYAGDTLYAVVSQTLHAFDPATGKEKWTYAPGRSLYWGPAVEGGAGR